MLDLDLNMPQKRVFIVGNGSLFDEGITELLARGTSLRVSHMVYSDDIAFLNIIKMDQPDVILVCESDTLDTERILDSISIDPIMIGLCIFVVRLSNPVIDVYERPILNEGKISYRPRSIIPRTANDLIDILRENSG